MHQLRNKSVRQGRAQLLELLIGATHGRTLHDMKAEKKDLPDKPMSLEEVARRMLAMPVKTRDEMTAEKAKPRKKK